MINVHSQTTKLTQLIGIVFGIYLFTSLHALASGEELLEADRLISEGKYEQALRILDAPKFSTNPKVNYTLGLMFENGHGTKRNISRALSHYEKAAMMRNVDAMINLASFHQEHPADNPNFKKAYYWFVKASETGDGQAIAALSSMHFIGNIFPPSDSYGGRFALLAAHKGWDYSPEFMETATQRFSKSKLQELREQLRLCDKIFGPECKVSKALQIDHGYSRTSEIRLMRYDRGLLFDTFEPTPISGFFNHFARTEIGLPTLFLKKNVRFYPNEGKPNVCILGGEHMDLVWFRNETMPEGKALELHPKDYIEFECKKIQLRDQ